MKPCQGGCVLAVQQSLVVMAIVENVSAAAGKQEWSKEASGEEVGVA